MIVVIANAPWKTCRAELSPFPVPMPRHLLCQPPNFRITISSVASERSREPLTPTHPNRALLFIVGNGSEGAGDRGQVQDG